MPKPEINIDKEIRPELIESLRKYYEKERGEEIGNLGAELLLDFILNEIGPYIYNQGIEDAYRYMNERTEDMLGLQKRFR